MLSCSHWTDLNSSPWQTTTREGSKEIVRLCNNLLNREYALEGQQDAFLLWESRASQADVERLLLGARGAAHDAPIEIFWRTAGSEWAQAHNTEHISTLCLSPQVCWVWAEAAETIPCPGPGRHWGTAWRRMLLWQPQGHPKKQSQKPVC